MRFITYGIELTELASNYAKSLRAHPSVDAWVSQALLETEIVEMDEAGEELD